MTFSAAPVLETERLRLRPYKLDDFEPFAALYASPTRSAYIDGPVARDMAWTLFAADIGRWALVGYGSWAIERKTDGVSVGAIGLNFPVKFAEPELGWVLWDGFEGQGYAEEATRRARQFAFEELGWETLVSYIDPRNGRSIRLAERMGAVLDTHAETPDGDPALVYRHKAP